MESNFDLSISLKSFSSQEEGLVPTNKKIIKESPEEIGELELKINNWLQEHNVFISIPEDREIDYYSNKRMHISANFKKKSPDHRLNSMKNSPLYQKRRNSTPSPLLENKNKMMIETSPLKMSKFSTMKFNDEFQQETNN